MTPAALSVLQDCARRLVVVDSRDKRWAAFTELQKAGLIRLEWNTNGKLRAGSTPTAGIVLTEAGKAELAKGAVR